MTKRKEKGFTLIELIGVLVIMAILALIVTPLVMNIIRKARVAADKRSVDAYGRSIEYAIAGYLLDNGRFPTSIDQLTIEYSGSEVVCETTQLNSDSSVYLTGCTVAGRTVDYAYGTDKTPPAPTYTAYSVGDEVTYNGVDYYVIKDSGVKEQTVTLLKAKPLSTAEVTSYKTTAGIGITSTTTVSYAEDVNGYGGMAFGESSNYYNTSYIKKVLDLWAVDKLRLDEVEEVRLITIEEIKNNFGYEWGMPSTGDEAWVPSESTPSWVYNINYSYWTSSSYEYSMYSVWVVGEQLSHGDVIYHDNDGYNHGTDRYVVRPVIVLSKSVL